MGIEKQSKPEGERRKARTKTKISGLFLFLRFLILEQATAAERRNRQNAAVDEFDPEQVVALRLLHLSGS